ncbi:unnamed protein product [[Candida] boidinii]|nr:unnamed protein product [[Candida] boidinii]
MSSSSATKTNDLNINRIDFEVQSKLNLMEREYFEHRFIILGGDLFLNNFKILDAIKKFFAKLSNEIEMGDRTIAPLCIIINGPFTDVPFEATSSTNSISTRISSSGIYKSLFDSLANILEKFPNISQRSTLVFVPGDNDPWSSLVSKGSNSIWPRSKIPKIFVNRLNRVVKDIHWVSNPSNLIYLNHEIRIVRDDIGARLRRNDISYLSKYNKDEEGDEVEENGASADNARKVTETLVDDLADEMENYDLEYNNLDNINDKDSLTIDKISDAGKTKFSADIIEARKIVKTILDQGHLSPFQSSVRPTIWNQDQSLWLLPLPTLLILTDTTSPAFDVTYEGCHVINPGSFINKNKITFIEYYPSSKKAELRSLYV